MPYFWKFRQEILAGTGTGGFLGKNYDTFCVGHFYPANLVNNAS